MVVYGSKKATLSMSLDVCWIYQLLKYSRDCLATIQCVTTRVDTNRGWYLSVALGCVVPPPWWQKRWIVVTLERVDALRLSPSSNADLMAVQPLWFDGRLGGICKRAPTLTFILWGQNSFCFKALLAKMLRKCRSYVGWLFVQWSHSQQRFLDKHNHHFHPMERPGNGQTRKSHS